MTDWLASRAASLLTFVIVLAIGFVGGWHIQTWRYGAMEKDRVQTQLESERLARRADVLRQKRVIVAQNASKARAADAGRDAAAARNELDSLRTESAATVARAQQSLAACTVAVDAFADVFGQCTSRYGEVAQKADGHANDAKTLIDAWPVE